MLALPAAAKSVLPVRETLGQDQCTPENKEAWYASFLENRQNDQAKANDLAKKYIACPVNEATTEPQKQIADYLKIWSGKYEKGIRKVRFHQLIYVDKKYPEAYAVGKEILTDEPENVKVVLDMGVNGYLVAAAKNPALTADAINFAKKAIQLLESGKAVDDWQPLSGKDEALAYLNYTLGYLTLDGDPVTALGNLIKAARFESPLKKSPYTYGYIEVAYEAGLYAKQSDEYKRLYEGKDETPESKLALANINQLVDRMIDAYARAIAVAGTDAKYQTIKTEWMENLSRWYKYRNNKSDAGMNELLAGILNKPLPSEPTPLTSLPASTPAATPASTSGASSTDGATANKPLTNSLNVPSGVAESANKPAAGTNKPKSPMNHR